MTHRKLSELRPAKYNPRKALCPGDPAYEKLKNSILTFGNVEPIVWNRLTGNVVGGHQRLQVLLDMGETESEVSVVELQEPYEKALNIALNKITGEWDEEKLSALLLDISTDIELLVTGFDNDEIEILLEDESEPVKYIDDDFEVPEAAKSKRGEIYQLGRHRLMCGDSTSEEDVAALMDGALANMVFTDPPYGVAIGDKNKRLNDFNDSNGIERNLVMDTATPEELYDFLKTAFTICKANCEEDASYYVTAPQGGDLGLVMLLMMRDSGLPVRHTLIWCKNAATFSMGRLDYDYRHEPMFYTWGKKHNYYGKGEHKNSVWEVKKPHRCDLHPTMKPVELIANAILNSSKENDRVLDIFGGSGSTLIACEQLDRSCYMMEIDPIYVDVIISRWESAVGERAVLIRTSQEEP